MELQEDQLTFDAVVDWKSLSIDPDYYVMRGFEDADEKFKPVKFKWFAEVETNRFGISGLSITVPNQSIDVELESGLLSVPIENPVVLLELDDPSELKVFAKSITIDKRGRVEIVFGSEE